MSRRTPCSFCLKICSPGSGVASSTSSVCRVRSDAITLPACTMIMATAKSHSTYNSRDTIAMSGVPGEAVPNREHTLTSGNSSMTRTRNKYRNVPSDFFVVSRHATGSSPGSGSPSWTSTMPPVTALALLKNRSRRWNHPSSTFFGGTNARDSTNLRAPKRKPPVSAAGNHKPRSVWAKLTSDARLNNHGPQPAGRVKNSTRNST